AGMRYLVIKLATVSQSYCIEDGIFQFRFGSIDG
ncbi:unnamed protein product, partial [marine sediment metagenome]